MKGNEEKNERYVIIEVVTIYNLRYPQIIIYDYIIIYHNVCPGSSVPPDIIFNIFPSENEVYNIY